MRTNTDAQLRAKALEAVTEISEILPAGAFHETSKRIKNVTPTCTRKVSIVHPTAAETTNLPSLVKQNQGFL